MKFSPLINVTKVLIVSAVISAPIVSQASEPLTEIVVTAELLSDKVLALPNSVTVIDNRAIQRRSARHLEDLLNLAPNVNFASGASRGRFVQIRGIGERSEFQEPIINSVGLIVDGIDMTGIATAASSLDIQQVEILRGPQGTLFGANALAGLINVVSNRPSDEFYARISAAMEEFGGLEWSAVVSGPTSQRTDLKPSGYRLAVKHYESDGFTENVFNQSDATGNINETSAKARYSTRVGDRLQLDFTVFLADIDNGYDAFSLDNSRQTYSDQPGADRQQTTAGSVQAQYELNGSLTFKGLFSAASSDLEYGYDEDWGHDGICENTDCDSDLFGFDWFYSSFDNYLRDNRNHSVDLKLISRSQNSLSWVVGLYHRDQSIDLDRQYTFAEVDFSSNIETTNTALYGQMDIPLSSRWSVSGGLRLEQRDVDYSDSAGSSASPDEHLWGGRLAIEHMADSGAFYYALISRGYKPGGFNLDESIPAEQREFDTETMLNYELGLKNTLLNGALQIQTALFYQDRNYIQTKQSIVTSISNGERGGTCPCSFTDFTDNAASGNNFGLEVELNWVASDKLNVFASLGLLETEFDTLLTFEHVAAERDKGIPFDLRGREQAHAPGYQWVIGGDYSITRHWRLSGSVEAKDEFFFSDRHEEESDAYQLFNLQLAYETGNWQVALYAKNLTDELVKTRGFGSFGNDPRKFYATEPYNQFAAPRVVGLKASMEF